jgi:hypothetical protein
VDLDVGDFSVACLRATSHGQALYVEETPHHPTRPQVESS